MKKYVAPLIIYIVWLPEKNEKGEITGIGLALAEYLYSIFNRDITNPISRGIGIPVFYRFIEAENNIPISINRGDSTRSMVVSLIDDRLLLNDDWRTYIESIYTDYADYEGSPNDLHRFIPIALSKNAHKISPDIHKLNFVNLHEITDIEAKKEELSIRLTHELCRLLHKEPSIAEIEKKTLNDAETPDLKLFLSYARKDGQTITDRLKAYLDSQTSLKTFLDKIDIPSGDEFQRVLAQNINKATILVILTDVYASREWCRWEIIQAKRKNRPIIVVNAIQRNELRSFPYLGNSPVVRYENIKGDDFLKRIFHTVLFEMLRYEYSKIYITNQTKLHKPDTEIAKILGSPPELLTLVGIAKTKGIVIYPDPPITKEESDLLEELEDYTFLTPTMLPAFNESNTKNV